MLLSVIIDFFIGLFGSLIVGGPIFLWWYRRELIFRKRRTIALYPTNTHLADQSKSVLIKSYVEYNFQRKIKIS